MTAEEHEVMPDNPVLMRGLLRAARKSLPFFNERMERARFTRDWFMFGKRPSKRLEFNASATVTWRRRIDDDAHAS